MTCTNCKKEINNDSNFCPNCGNLLILDIGEDIYNKDEKIWKWTLYFSTILSSILLVFYTIYWSLNLYNSVMSMYCNEQLLGEYLSCGSLIKIDIPYYTYVNSVSSILLGIFAILQIFSFFKLKKIYKYNAKNNIVRPNTVYVKKSTYILIASSLGILGLHKFYAKKKLEGFIFLIIFVGSIKYQPLLIFLIITTSISFADIAIAMAQKADHNKNILI